MASVSDVEFFIYDPDGIGRHKIDIESSAKFPLSMTYSIKDVRDLSKSKGTYSKTFQVPASKNNNSAFKLLFSDAYRDTFDIAGMKDCAVYVGGTEVVRGQCSIKSGSKKESPTHYNVQLFASNNQWVNDLAGVPMCDIDFTIGQTLFPGITQDINQVYDKDSIEATWEISDADSGFMVYPLINTGQWYYDDVEGIYIENFLPAYFIRNMVHICFAQIGYTVESDFMETDWFKKQLIFPGKQEFSLSGTTVTEHSFLAERQLFDGEWSRPEQLCSRQNAKYVPCTALSPGLTIWPNDQTCTYFEGGLTFEYHPLSQDPDDQVAEGTILGPDFKLDTLETFMGDAMFAGWRWKGRRGDLRIIGAWEGSDNDGRDYGWIRCHDEYPSWARAGQPIDIGWNDDDTINNYSSWKYRYYPWSSEKCTWPKVRQKNGIYASAPGQPYGLTEDDLECQDLWWPGVTVNTNGYWNWFAINFCDISVFRCLNTGVWLFSGGVGLELNIHRIWRWNRGYSNTEEWATGDNTNAQLKRMGEMWEYTIPCWEPSLYWRSGLIPQDNHNNTGGNDGFDWTEFPMWKLHLFEGPMSHGMVIRGGDGDGLYYDTDIMYTGEKEKYNTNTYNPSFMRCGDRPECYVNNAIPTTPSGGTSGALHYEFNPYSPWNIDWGGFSGMGAYESCPLADWTPGGAPGSPGTSWYTWGENMCPMRANYQVTYQSGVGSVTGPYWNYNWEGAGGLTTSAGAQVVPCYWTFRRSYVTFRANLYLCVNRLNAAGDNITNWDGRKVWDTYMVATDTRDNSRYGWCMCSDELCNDKGPYWNPNPMGGSVWNTTSNTHGCAVDCWWGAIETEGGADYSSECLTNPYGMTKLAAEIHEVIREGYRAMKTPDDHTTINYSSSIWEGTPTSKFCCDGSGDRANALNPTGGNSMREVTCQPLLEDGTKITWDNIIPYNDWDNTENLPNFDGSGTENLCRQPKQRGIHQELPANFSRLYSATPGSYTTEDPTGYYGGGGINFSLNFSDIEMEMLYGEFAFLYAEVYEQLYEYGTTPDSQGTVMNYNSRRTNWFGNWADPSISPSVYQNDTLSPPEEGNSPGWNTTGIISSTQGYSLNMFSWCCHNEWDDGIETNDRGWWIGAAFQCYGEGTCDNNMAHRYCGPGATTDGEDDPDDNVVWGCATEPGNSSLQQNWGRNFQAPADATYGDREGHNTHWGIMTHSVGAMATGGGQGNGGRDTFIYSHWAWEPVKLRFKKTSFRQKANSWFKGELTDAITIGGTYPINDTLPCSETMLDFINGLTGLYNLYWTADMANKTIKVEPYNDFYDTPNNAVSWTKKLDTSKENKNILSNDYLRRHLCFTYKEDSSDVLAVETHKLLDTNSCHYSSFYRELSDDFINEEQKIGTNYYGPSLMAFDMTIAVPETLGLVPWIPFINKEYTTLVNLYDNSDLPEKMEKWRARTLQWGGMQPMNRDVGEVATNNTIIMGETRMSYPFAGTYDIQNGVGGVNTFGSLTTGGRTFNATTLDYHNRNMQYNGPPGSYPVPNGGTAYGLYEMFYEKQIEALIDRPKLKECYIKLTPRDIAELDFSRIVHLALGETDTYWTINRVVDYQPHKQGLTKVELLEFVNYIPGDAQGGGNPSSPNKGLVNQYNGFYLSTKRADWKNKVVASTSGKISNVIDKKISDLKVQLPSTRSILLEARRKRRNAVFNSKGKQNTFIGSGSGPFNIGIKTIGENIKGNNQNQIGIGTGNIADNQIMIGAGGEDQITFKENKVSVGNPRADEQILVTNAAGELVPLYAYDVNPNFKTALAYGNKQKLSPVKMSKYNKWSDFYRNNPKAYIPEY